MSQTIEVENEFYQTVGKTITEWSGVERALSELFADALSTPHRNLGIVAFYAAQTFQTKLAMTTDTLSVRLRFTVGPGKQHNYKPKPHKIFDRWKPIHKRLDRLSKKRNLVAHRPVSQVFQGGIMNIAIRPHTNNAKNLNAMFDDSQALDQSKLYAMKRDFWLISHAINDFRGELDPVLAQLPITPG